MNSLAGPVSRNLVCHPQSRSPGVDAIDVQVEHVTNGKLALSFVLQGNLAKLRIPGQKPCRRMDELWRHTCFEMFLMTGDGPGYREYNFSPSGEWATYAFRDYRQAVVTTDESDPLIRVQRSAQRLALQAEVSLESLSSYRSLRLGLSAVVEAADGSLSYWALRHPPGKPDFHHVDAFALQLEWS